MLTIRQENIRKLAVLLEKMDNFSRTLYLAQLKKFDSVEAVYNTEKFNDKTLGQIIDEHLKPLIDHSLTLNEGVHKNPYSDILPN